MAEAHLSEDFDTAKTVTEKLEGLSKERRERVLRWVCEGLGITNPAAPIPAVPPPAPPAKPGTAANTAVDIKTFVNAKKPKSDMQFVAVVAHYYRFEAPENLRKATITAEVVQDAARLAGRRVLQAAKNTLKNAKNQGYLDNPSRGEYAINTVGENLVAMSLPASNESSPRRGAKKSKKKAAKKRS